MRLLSDSTCEHIHGGNGVIVSVNPTTSVSAGSSTKVVSITQLNVGTNVATLTGINSTLSTQIKNFQVNVA